MTRRARLVAHARFVVGSADGELLYGALNERERQTRFLKELLF